MPFQHHQSFDEQYIRSETEKTVGNSDADVAVLVAKIDSEDEQLWLPLITHLEDTAAVMEYLITHWLPERYCENLELSWSDFYVLAIASALLHDVGKSTKLFQQRITERRPDLQERLYQYGLETTFDQYTLLSSGTSGKVPHGTAGAEILRLEDEFGESLPAIVGAHHGVPESYENVDVPLWKVSPKSFGWSGSGDRNTSWGHVQKKLIRWGSERIKNKFHEPIPECSMMAQMALTGLVIMADWIASNTAYFPLIPIDEVPQSYDFNRAEKAIRKLNLPAPWRVSETWKSADFFRERFDFCANDVQKKITQVAAEMKTPGIMILEAPMGHGKTEAALSTAEILMNRFQLSGAAVFLPSQATSNAMFSRMTQWAKHQPDAIRLAVELVHGQAEFNSEFERMGEGSVQIEQGENTSDQLIVHSFFRGRKTRLLANLVVGTVDQLLMAGLKQKHVMLRHLGLLGKVIIIDECHAYDAYMNTYLDRVLDWLGAYHVPVILLSATLPGKRRAELLNAYLGKRKAAGNEIETNQAYPLLCWTENEKICMESIPSAGETRSVKIQKTDEEQAIEEIGQALKSGCVGVIVNTVRRAQLFRKQILGRYPETHVLMDHSRFLAPDRLKHEDEIIRCVGKRSTEELRKGVLVIGTQVLEQSLDLDFDLLVTDLCPMDLLLQRIGRLHRHTRNRPVGLEIPRCLVMGALGELDRGSKSVYGEYLLIRSQALLPDVICLPDDISPLVQKTYDEKMWNPLCDAQYQQARDAYELEKKSQMKRAKSYRLEAPARDGFDDSIVGLMDYAPGLTDPQAQAAVRDGTTAIEVLVVQKTEDNMVQLIAGDQKDVQYRMDTQPSADEARKIAEQRLRLPAYFSQTYCVDSVIKDLETQTETWLRLWLQAPMLESELFLILDTDGVAELAGKRLHYDSEVGLKEEENVNGTDNV